MTREEFARQISRLGAAFHFPSEEKIQVYFDELGGEASERDLADAVTRLIHSVERFPTVREIEEEISDVRRERRVRAPGTDVRDLAPCLDCNGTGLIVEDLFSDDGPRRVAKYCECPKGRTIRAGHEAYFKGVRYGQRRRKP